jgi:hypothetical protein
MGMPVLRYLALDLMAVADARQRGGERRAVLRRRFRLAQPRAQAVVLAPAIPVAPVVPIASVARMPAAVAVEATVS